MDIKRIEAAAKAAQLPRLATSTFRTSNLSFDIVNSKRNGKRVKLSKDLAQAVDLTDSADMLPLEEEGLLMVAKKLPFEAACPVLLKGDNEAKIAYNSGVVALLTQMFGLNFADHTSMSFSNITIDKLEDGTPVALIPIYNKYPANGADAAEGQ